MESTPFVLWCVSKILEVHFALLAPWRLHRTRDCFFVHCIVLTNYHGTHGACCLARRAGARMNKLMADYLSPEQLRTVLRFAEQECEEERKGRGRGLKSFNWGKGFSYE